MTPDADAALVRRFIDEVFVACRGEAVDELVAGDFVGHTWGPRPVDRGFLRAAVDRIRAGLSDIAFEVRDLVAQDGRVAVRVQSSARHTGEFMGLPASGRRYEIDEMHWFRVADGRIAEHWHVLDAGALLRQLTEDGEPADGSEDRGGPADDTPAADRDPAPARDPGTVPDPAAVSPSGRP